MLLGMPVGTASARLLKSILFSLVVKTDQNFCHRCGGCIERVIDLSIEHKNSWQQADDPVAAFFDLENITFSHRSCNYGAASRPYKRFATDVERYKFHNKRPDRQHNHTRKAWRQRRREAGLPYT